MLDTANRAARAIVELPHWMTGEARDRVERFRRKLHSPLVWSGKKWTETCDNLAMLASEIPDIQYSGESSPVGRLLTGRHPP